ncbi:hypothetical protein HYC85_003524 [Camellia sinensis]|uniref:Sugar phosphate transporter domain-containing protein n=1 Tax=Camellia sinensis TaxID=4442 RepID=A0A7J7HUI6_CAMSI|nr:hypothetical protein HYC85_003524 [Camellia sinensis]
MDQDDEEIKHHLDPKYANVKTSERHVWTRLYFTSLVCSCIFLYAMKYWKIISFTDGEPEGITTNWATLVPLKTLCHTIPLATSYLLYMLASMESVRGISVPMYTTLRRTAIAFMMVTEYLLVGQKHSPSVVCNSVRPFWCFTAGKSSGLNSFGLMWCNGKMIGLQ